MTRKWALGASLLGAGLMYLLDPDSGERRRRRILDRTTSLGRQSRELSRKAAREIGHRAHDLSQGIQAGGLGTMVREVGHRVHDLAHEVGDRSHDLAQAVGDRSHDLAQAVGNRSHDLAHEVGDRFGAATEVFEAEAPDRLVVERVRSKMGHLIAYPGAVDVQAENGRVVLCGNVLPDEMDRLLSTIESIPGVRHVENRLQVTAFPGRGPRGDQLGFRTRLARLDTPVARLAVGTLGAMIAAYGISRMRGDAMPLGRPIAAEMKS